MTHVPINFYPHCTLLPQNMLTQFFPLKRKKISFTFHCKVLSEVVLKPVIKYIGYLLICAIFDKGGI